MKCVILAGGLGTRISEETHLRPKPMIEIGDQPILWHIIKHYAHHGINDFIVCLGYRGYMVKEYFANYMLHRSDVTFDLGTGETTFHNRKSEDWRITLVETGEHTMTGGRVGLVAGHLDKDEPFCLTYGDGVSDIDVGKLIESHKNSGKEATVTAVAPPGRYGAIELEGSNVLRFKEKPAGDGGLINGGFFVAEPSVLSRITGTDTVWETGPLEGLAEDGQLNAFIHDGFWHAMDTLRDKRHLESLWASGNPPWKTWN